MIILSVFLITSQIFALFFLYVKTKQCNQLEKNGVDITSIRTKSDILEKSIEELKSNNKALNDRIMIQEVNKRDLINRIESLKSYEEKNDLLDKKNSELLKTIEKKDAELDKLREEKNKFENLYNIEKSTYSDKDSQIKKYILDLLEKNKEIIDKSFEEKNKISNQNFSELTSNLMENYKKITEKVLNIESKNNTTEKVVDELKNSLIVPYKAGHTSEITLENILSNSGLRKKNFPEDDGDYITQVNLKVDESILNENSLRPDAIVYLPNNNYLIIDSKTSSHFVELQNAIDNDDQTKQRETEQKLKGALNKHLNDLISKDYRKALFNYLNGNSDIEPTIMTIMFVQTEGIMSLIRKIDPNLETKALKAGIPIASPLGLINLLNISKYTIHKDIQDKNIDKLKQEIFTLMDNLSTIFERTEKVGKKLYEAVGNYNELTTTYNSNLLTRIKNIQKLGVKGKKELPNKLSRFDLQRDIIDGEIANVNNNLIEQ